MRKFVKWAIWTVAALMVAFLAGGYLLPGEAVVQRQTIIAAPPEKVFPLIGDLRRFKEWSPWAELDPATDYRFEGPEKGVGQKMHWSSSHKQVGKGSQTVTAFEENKRMATKLDFGEMGKASATMELAPVNGGTGVTWGFKSKLDSPFDRWMGLMFNRWIGADYEKGLAKLKALAEQ